MRRIFLFALLFWGPLLAAQVGNPAIPALAHEGFFSGSYPWVKFSTGYIDDYISNKRYVTSDSATFDPNKTFKQFGLHNQAASFSLLLFERLEFYGTTGGSKEHIKWSQEPASTSFAIHSNYSFSWSAGMRVVVLPLGPFYIGGTAGYFEIPKSHKAFFKFLNRLDLPLETDRQEFRIREWQGCVGLSLRMWFLSPYVGAQYLRSRLDIDAGPENPTLKYRNREQWGYFWGLTLSLTPKFLISGERRVRGEFAYTLSTEAVF